MPLHSSGHFDGRCAQQDIIITPCHGQKYLYYSTEDYRQFFFTEEDLVFSLWILDGIILLTRFSISSSEFVLLFSPLLSVSQTRSDFEVRHLSTQRLRSEIIRLSSAMLIDEYVFFVVVVFF